MTFQEKSAWVMILALVVSGAFYALSIYGAATALGDIPPPNGVGMSIAVVIIVAIAIFGHAVAALGNLSDASAPEDERDRIVVRRAGNLSGALLGVCCILSIIAYAVIQHGNMLFHAIVFGLVLSQVAEYALTIWFYRRGV
ncbi:MAG: hypothetical protein AAFV59_05400 [Pseudomonadota bacterium]